MSASSCPTTRNVDHAALAGCRERCAASFQNQPARLSSSLFYILFDDGNRLGAPTSASGMSLYLFFLFHKTTTRRKKKQDGVCFLMQTEEIRLSRFIPTIRAEKRPFSFVHVDSSHTLLHLRLQVAVVIFSSRKDKLRSRTTKEKGPMDGSRANISTSSFRRGISFLNRLFLLTSDSCVLTSVPKSASHLTHA